MHFLDGEGLPKFFSKSVHRTHNGLHTFLLLKYTSYSKSINGNAGGLLFERWMPRSMVPVHFLYSEKLPKICFKCVCRTQPELHTFLLLQYTSPIVAIVNLLNINGDAAGLLFKQQATSIAIYRFTIAAIAIVYWSRKKVCSSGCVRQIHLEQIFGSSSPSRKCIHTILETFIVRTAGQQHSHWYLL